MRNKFELDLGELSESLCASAVKGRVNRKARQECAKSASKYELIK